jgi:phospholipid N-methyltransferase
MIPQPIHPPVEGNTSLLFLRKFLRHGTRVASVAPSSRALASAMCKFVDPHRPQTIVEVGAGTGAVTAVVAERMHPDSRLIALELDPQFASVAEARCPRAEVICANVRDLSLELERLRVNTIDVLLSGLPVPSLPRDLNANLFEALGRYGSEAMFSQLTLMPWVYQRTYERLFEQVDFQLVVCNVPPGGVYHCRRLRSGSGRRVPGKSPSTANAIR